MRIVVRVLRKRQVTLPKEVCEKLGIEEGDRLELRVTGDQIVLKKLDPLELLEGALKPHGKRVEGLAELIDRERKVGERLH